MYSGQNFHKSIRPNLKSEFKMKNLYFTNCVLHTLRVYFILIISTTSYENQINSTELLGPKIPFLTNNQNFSDAKPISNAFEDMLNSEAPITPIQDDI